jgi:hypothetical protein
MELLLAHDWVSCWEPFEHWLDDQVDQVIDSWLSFSQLLENMACDNASLPLGAWQNLLCVAQDNQANQN